MSNFLAASGSHGTARIGRQPRAGTALSARQAVRRAIDRPPLRLMPDTSDAGGSRFRGGLAGGALRRVKSYIEDHIGERISLDELARQVGVSRFHFARQFRLSTGESPMGYLRQVRIERSKSILQARETTIAEVAARLGFSDQSHFTRIFGRLVGVSPGSFVRDEWTPNAAAGR
jgi:AraC family transcriptional regulator